ncbi:hypothetical protein, partial [Methylobacterium brachythecii]
MIARVPLKAALVAASLLLAARAMAQEPEAASPPAGEQTQPKPANPKPRPKPKPKPKPAPQAEQPDAGKPPLRTGGGEPQGAAAVPPLLPAAPPTPAAVSGPPVACDPGQSVLYDGPKEFSVWVTRTGAVTVDNPLRPLTPDVTRVVQLVIGDKIATAYGRDLASLRRGASPAALESLLGGPVRWDAQLGTLPDSFEIVSDANAPLAQMRFKECGTAPAAKAAPVPVAKKDAKKEKKPKAPRKEPAGAAAGGTAPAGRTAAPPRQFN